jgi:pyruvate kinase
LVLNDGLIVLTVLRIEGQAIYTRVTLGGQLSDRKGINRFGGGLSAATLTQKDKADIQTAMSFKADYLAISFPKNAADMNEARQLADKAGEQFHHKTLLIAKIERAEAIAALDELIAASDGIMVARGDLAIEVGAAAVPALQKKMIKLARAANKLSITATQMMESMTLNPIPTRAEVSDVANAVLDGSDAVMASGETAVGRYPVETVKMMAEVCLAAETFKKDAIDVDCQSAP